jgi:signal peptidase I
MFKFIVAVLLLIFIEISVASLFRVTSGSMEDTLAVGDTMVVLKFWYGIKLPFIDSVILSGHTPKSDDVLLFRNPRNSGEIVVKRCVAAGGQTVEIRAKEVFINGVGIPLPPHGKHKDPSIFPKGTSNRDFMKRITIPDSEIFVLGDNRDFSGDSREFGPIPTKNLIGKAWIIAFSLDPDVPWKDFTHKFRKNRVLVPIR